MTNEECFQRTMLEVDTALTQSKLWQIQAQFYMASNAAPHLIEDALQRSRHFISEAQSLIDYSAKI